MAKKCTINIIQITNDWAGASPDTTLIFSTFFRNSERKNFLSHFLEFTIVGKLRREIP